MPKHAPTQFYTTNDKDGMKLRSGKRINCFKTTEFGKDTHDLLHVFRLCDIVDSEHRGFTGNDWYDFEYYDPDEIDTVERMAGGLFSPLCTRMIALESFIAKWRQVINNDFILSFRDVICQKIREAIERLQSMEKNESDQFCGCGDRTHLFNDDIAWDYYIGFGPGFLQENEEGMMDWILTPEISHEEFEDIYYENRNSWRHDLLYLRERFESHLAYFNRVPHKIHQQVFFALSSKSTPSACAKHILSFL